MRWSAALLPALLVTTFMVLTARVPDHAPDVRFGAIAELVTEGWPALLWLLSAAGLGSVTAALFITPARDARERFHAAGATPLAGPLGIALMLCVDQVAGSLGAFAHPIGAWMLLVPGWIMLLLASARFSADRARRRAAGGHHSDSHAITRARLHLHAWPLAPAMAVLIVAALSSPGFLWSTEFGGYDALSYHLALPRDWIEAGRLAPHAWNAYSFLPSWIEGATLHLFALGGDPALLGIRAQLLHALLTLVTCWCVGDATVRLWRERRRAATADDTAFHDRDAEGAVALLAAALFLGTPWIVVTGSMAYNEMGAALACSALVLVWFTDMTPMRRGVLLGLFAAMAVGSKLSAAVIVLPPLAVLMVIAHAGAKRASLADATIASPHGGTGAFGPWSSGAAMIFAGLVVGTMALLPWMLRNAIATGNPLFPFAASMLGAGEWSAEQVAVWNAAHGATGDMTTRLLAVWNQVLRFGVGENPIPAEPWRPFWGVLPWIAIGGCIVLVLAQSTRRIGVALLAALMAAVLGWMLFTHMKSRFLVPVAPIAAMAGALALALVMTSMAQRWRLPAMRSIASAAIALVLTLQPVAAFVSEGPDAALMLSAERSMTGDELAQYLAASPSSAQKGSPARSRAFMINFEIGPRAASAGERVLLIGDAATFRYRAPIRWSTVWTRDPLVSAIVRAAADVTEQPMVDGGIEGQRRTIASLLRAERVGWVVIDPNMLAIWSRSGWIDPAITVEAIKTITGSLQPFARLDDGSLVLRVPDSPPSPPPVLR